MSSTAPESVNPLMLPKEPRLTVRDLPTRAQMADRLFSESCTELARIRDMLSPAFKRYQKALDATAETGRECKFPGMGKLLTEAWKEFVVQQTVEAERRKTK